MIPLQFGLFYAGSPMSYLRYLCFKTLRHFHPDSKIQLYTTEKSAKTGHNWNREKQDFESPYSSINYMDKLKDLGVEIIVMKGFLENQNAVVQSDFFRYWWLKNGGIYLDTDQIILKSFSSLPLDKELIYSLYPNIQCGIYAPVGVLAATKDSKIIDYVTKNLSRYFSPNNYNSSGPHMFLDVLRRFDLSNSYNAPSYVFYPAHNSDRVTEIIDGTLVVHPESLAIHLFMGHPLSQEFNKKYTEEFAKTNNDTVSIFLRENKLL